MILKPGLTMQNADSALPKGFHSSMTQGDRNCYVYKRKHRGLRLQVEHKFAHFQYARWGRRVDSEIKPKNRFVCIRPMNGHERSMSDIISIHKKAYFE